MEPDGSGGAGFTGPYAVLCTHAEGMLNADGSQRVGSRCLGLSKRSVG